MIQLFVDKKIYSIGGLLIQDSNSKTTGKKDPGKFENLDQALNYFNIKEASDLEETSREYFENMSYATFCSLLEIGDFAQRYPNEIFDWLEEIDDDSISKIIVDNKNKCSEDNPEGSSYEDRFNRYNYKSATSKTFSLEALKVILNEEFELSYESEVACGVFVRSYLKFSSEEREEFNKFKNDLQSKWKEKYEGQFFSEEQLKVLKKVDSLFSDFRAENFKLLFEEHNIKFVPQEIIFGFAKLEENDRVNYKKIFVESVKKVFLSTDKDLHNLLIELSKSNSYSEIIVDAISELQNNKKDFDNVIKIVDDFELNFFTSILKIKSQELHPKVWKFLYEYIKHSDNAKDSRFDKVFDKNNLDIIQDNSFITQVPDNFFCFLSDSESGQKLLNELLRNWSKNIYEGFDDCLKNDIGFSDEEASIELKKLLIECSPFYELENPQQKENELLDKLKENNRVKKSLGDQNYDFVKKELKKVLMIGFYDDIQDYVYTGLYKFLDQYFSFDKDKEGINKLISHLQAGITPLVQSWKLNNSDVKGAKLSVDNIAKDFVDEHNDKIRIPIDWNDTGIKLGKLITQYDSLRKEVSKLKFDNKNENKSGNLIETDTMSRFISRYIFDVLPDSIFEKFFKDKKILANAKRTLFKNIIEVYGNRISKEKYNKMFRALDSEALYLLTRDIISEITKQTRYLEKKNEKNNICFVLPNINLFGGEYIGKFTSFVLGENTLESLGKYGNGELLQTITASFDGIKTCNMSKELFTQLNNYKKDQILDGVTSKFDRNFLQDLYKAKPDVLFDTFNFFNSRLKIFKKEIERLQVDKPNIDNVKKEKDNEPAEENKKKREDLNNKYGKFVVSLCGFLGNANDDIFLEGKVMLPALNVFMSVVLFNYDCYITLKDKFKRLIFDNDSENEKIGNVIVKVCDLLKNENKKNEEQKLQLMNKDILDELDKNINVLGNIDVKMKNEIEKEGVNISDVLSMLAEIKDIAKNESVKEKEGMKNVDVKVETFNKLSELILAIEKLSKKLSNDVKTRDEGISKAVNNIEDILQKEKDKIKLQPISSNALKTVKEVMNVVLEKYYNKAMDEDKRKVSAEQRITDTKVITQIVDYLSTNGNLLTKDIFGGIFVGKNITEFCNDNIINKFVNSISLVEINRDIREFKTYTAEKKIVKLNRYYRPITELHKKCLILHTNGDKYVYWEHDFAEESLFNSCEKIVPVFCEFLIKYNGIDKKSNYVPKIINMMTHINFIKYVCNLQSKDKNIDEKQIGDNLKTIMEESIRALGEKECTVDFTFDFWERKRLRSRADCYRDNASLKIDGFGSNSSNYINIEMNFRGCDKIEDLEEGWKNFGGTKGYFRDRIYKCETNVHI